MAMVGISSGRSPADVDNQWDRVASGSIGWDGHVDLYFAGINQAIKGEIGGWNLRASQSHAHREHRGWKWRAGWLGAIGKRGVDSALSGHPKRNGRIPRSRVRAEMDVKSC